MTEYHTVYKGPEGESTQWDDIQAKLGNRPAKEPVWKPDAYEPAKEAERQSAERIDAKQTVEELEELEDDFGDDRVLEKYRQQRMAELKAGAARPRFGSLEQIRQNEWVAQVTNAPQGVWVVAHLYKDSVQDCAILNQCLEEVARQYPATKFVKIISTECIPGYPDANLPTVLLYRDTKCAQTLVGLRHFGGHSTSPELVAISLNRYGQVCGDEEDQEAQVRGLINRLLLERAEQQQGGGDGGAAAGAAGEQQQEDEDSDFD
ncbi:Phosducin 3 [Chlorella sorokiniana]|uniref:Phosducin 3 n=1 Tax=Chlorella sorokiniana TaxID=3076 RepID=A0A2P6TC43_CHLSO|nr:Phosducin 3 [Chlorella sorokiniana]|eukprot:PRW20210.1 Phosducin 3 [Chlorella sorokiniana]